MDGRPVALRLVGHTAAGAADADDADDDDDAQLRRMLPCMHIAQGILPAYTRTQLRELGK